MYEFYKKTKKNIINNNNQNINQNINENLKNALSSNIDTIYDKIKNLFSDANDLVLRKIEIGDTVKKRIVITYIDGLIDKRTVNNHILQPLIVRFERMSKDFDVSNENIISLIKDKLSLTTEIKEERDFDKAITNILHGNLVLFIDKIDTALIIDAKGWDARNVTEPDSETSIRGPREGFVESIRTNTALIRRIIKDTNLKFESVMIGKHTKTDVSICYIKGIAHKDIIDTLKRRIKKINIDAILDSGYIEQFIEDAPYSLFPTVGNSEKPDKVAAKLLEGRVAVIVEGSPVVLTVPFLFIEAIQTSEDYYMRFIPSSFNRILRFISLLISITLPGVYVALIIHHFEIIPFQLALSIAATREGIPFSPTSEAFFMIIVFELLKEAGIRMPKAVGQAVNIVGALVIGQAAVEAGLVSSIMLIIIALTGVSTFIVPTYSDTIPIIRIVVIIAGSLLGFLGVFLVEIVLIIYLSSLRSFGIPYLYPIVSLDTHALKDTLLRFPIWKLNTRPRLLTWKYDKDLKNRMDKITIKKED